MTSDSSIKRVETKSAKKEAYQKENKSRKENKRNVINKGMLLKNKILPQTVKSVNLNLYQHTAQSVKMKIFM